MNDLILGIIVAVALAGGIYLITRLSKRAEAAKNLWQALDGLGIPKHVAEFKHAALTPKGIEVKSTVPVPPEALATIDAGIDEQMKRFAVAYPDWPAGKRHSEYRVLFIDPMASNQDGSPAILVKGIQTAGTCIGVHPGSPSRQPWIVLPHQANRDWRFGEYLRNSAWFESEHYVEWLNDYPTFLRFVGEGDVHPHVGTYLPASAAGFKAAMLISGPATGAISCAFAEKNYGVDKV